MSRTKTFRLAGVGAVAAVAALGWIVTTGGDEGVGDVGAVAPVEIAEPVVVPVAQVDGPFDITYRVATLGMEIIDNTGAIVQPATLEPAEYRLTYRSERDWEIRNLDSGDRTVYANGQMEQWSEGELLAKAAMENAVLPERLTMPLAVDEFHEHLEARGFSQTERSSQDSSVVEVYERTAPKPEGEHYQSLPWHEDGNSEQVHVTYDAKTRRVVHYEQSLNGFVGYEYDLLDTK